MGVISGGISLNCGGLYGRASVPSMHRVVMRELDPRILWFPQSMRNRWNPRGKLAADGGGWASAPTPITFARAGAQSNVKSR